MEKYEKIDKLLRQEIFVKHILEKCLIKLLRETKKYKDSSYFNHFCKQKSEKHVITQYYSGTSQSCTDNLLRKDCGIHKHQSLVNHCPIPLDHNSYNYKWYG